jgi:hypothetical protein
MTMAKDNTRGGRVEKMCGFRHTLQIKVRTSLSRRHTKTGRIKFLEELNITSASSATID